ncbi:hypothetical protein DY000_02036772 [Brassica cretica]|uniref:RING-CH-type domain-containing protein n=1 Tax=Brassica cretica TaxID=69181 RepID=A0ABQ7BR70_BRACR|nr:hypothetical protein DY000_02036772 [Brassica cretica]
MDVFPAENEDGGYDRALPAEESDKDDDDDDGGDLCRICRSPEGPNDPLRYPCACRGSIKYVHQECLRLWLNRRGYKQCEVCGRSYSFVPVYSENAPERLPRREFVRGLSLRALGVAAYAFVILFKAFCFSLHPWGRRAAIENQRVFRISYGFTDGENEPRRGGGVACVFWKSVGVLCDFGGMIFSQGVDSSTSLWLNLVKRGLVFETHSLMNLEQSGGFFSFLMTVHLLLCSSLSQENITGISHGSSGTMDSFSKNVEKSICVSRRLELVSDCPLVMILHWAFGQLCLLLVFNSMELIQKILQKRPFWFLLDVTDPKYKITKLYLGQFLFALAFHASLMVILVHLPIMTISFISPSFFPLQFWICEERIMFLSMAAYVLLVRIGAMEWLDELIKPAMEPIVHKWIITVSSWLQLSDFFLENHANQKVRPLLQQELEARDSWSILSPIAEGSLVRFYESQNDATSEEDTDDDRFITLRIGLMFVLAALSLFLISTISMALPILVGRTFFHCIYFIMINFRLKNDDVYGFWIGCYILRVSYVGTCFIFNLIMNRRTDLLLNLVLLWIRNTLLLSIWVSFMPMLLGLLIDLMIIIPSQVPLKEPPVYLLLRDWLIGLVVLHIWTYLTMFTRVNCFATVACREKLDRIKSVGINRLPWTWLLGNVMFDQAVQRLIWPVLLAIIILGLAAKLTLDLFLYIHRLEYDDRYMVGDRVADFIEDQEYGIKLRTM